MWKHKKSNHLLSLSVALVLFLQINAICGATLKKSTAPQPESNSGEHHSGMMLKRQTHPSGSFGFQHNNLPTSASNYYPNQYDSRSNSLYPISNPNLRNDLRDRDYYYPPTLTSYTARSTNGGVGGSYYNYREKDEYRGDYRDRDRQPYYDDYRYNNYQDARDREAIAAKNLEYIMRNGQQRHSEYQKRIGQAGQTSQDYYDPFYFIGIRNKNLNPNGAGLDGNIPSSGSGSGLHGSRASSFLPSPSSSSGTNGLLSPSTTSGSGSATTVNSNQAGPNSNPNPNLGQATSSSAPANHPLRNRRNSHQRPDDFYNNDIVGDKYELMSAKSAYPPLQRNNNHPHLHNRWSNNHHHLDQQFLTREQLVRQHPDSRVAYPPHNHLDRDKYSSSASGLPWSVRIGTQLKVNDDGRAPNSHRFYVRDEVSPTRSRSRYPGPIYRKK